MGGKDSAGPSGRGVVLSCGGKSCGKREELKELRVTRMDRGVK